jgi:hypothetical protein
VAYGQSRDIPGSDAILVRVMWLSTNGIAHVAFHRVIAPALPWRLPPIDRDRNANDAVGERYNLEHSHARGAQIITEFEDLLISPAHSGQEGPLCFVRRLLRLRSYGRIHTIRIVSCDFAFLGFLPYRFPIE